MRRARRRRADRTLRAVASLAIREILVVDDSSTELARLSALLTARGFEVRTARSGEEALQRLQERRPDLLLLDVVMPGPNGYALTRRVTRDPRYDGLPVILCTSKGQASDRVWGLRQGARDYIVKPVDGDDLIARIRACERDRAES